MKTSYGCQIWRLCDNTNSHRILTLQKAALRLITFSAPRTPSNPIFSNLGILKFFDIVEVLNILFVHQYLNQNLPSDLLKTLKFIKISHSFNTRDNVLGLLKLPSVKTHNYGSNSFSNLQFSNGMISNWIIPTWTFLNSHSSDSKLYYTSLS